MHGWPAKPTSQPFFSDLQLTCSTLHFGHFFSLLQRITSATSYPARIGVHVCPQEFSILDPIDGIDKAGAGGQQLLLLLPSYHSLSMQKPSRTCQTACIPSADSLVHIGPRTLIDLLFEHRLIDCTADFRSLVLG